MILATVSVAVAEKRVALVIGNSAYSNVSKLANPASDATKLAEQLEGIGFDSVTLKLDQAYSDLRRTLSEFSLHAAGADVALVYFAGHGMEVGGTNYVIPVDAKLSHVDDVEFEAIELSKVMFSLNRASKLKLVILDACRNNPFKTNMVSSDSNRSVGRGLARVTPPGSDTLVAYAAKEGTVAADGDGSNSPYTKALIKHISTPGLDIRLMFGRVRDEVLAETGRRQEPFTYGSLPGQQIFLAPPTVIGNTQAANSSDIQQQLDELREELKNKEQTELSNLELKAQLKMQQEELDKLKQQNQRAEQEPVLPPATTRPASSEGLSAYEQFLKGQQAERVSNFREAVHWYGKAALQGRTDAMLNMGRAYEEGKGVHADKKTAIQWYKRAAEAGNAKAGARYAVLVPGGLVNSGSGNDGLTAYEQFQRGQSDERGGNFRSALRWFQKAAKQGQADAMFRIGHAYEQGNGVDVNVGAAREWYQRALDAGQPKAGAALSKLSSSQSRTSAGQSLAIKSAEELVREGLAADKRKDYRTAFKAWKQAADMGSYTAMFNIGILYHNGQGAKRNYREAASWIFKSLQGHPEFAAEFDIAKSKQWSREFRQHLQSELKRNGLYSGPIDGAFGSQTIRAIEKLTAG